MKEREERKGRRAKERKEKEKDRKEGWRGSGVGEAEPSLLCFFTQSCQRERERARAGFDMTASAW